MSEVLASCMTPVHIAPIVAVRVMLIEQMIIAIVVYKSVGIVIPMRILREMILITVKLGIIRIIALAVIDICELNL